MRSAPAGGADLSGYSTEELMKMRASDAPKKADFKSIAALAMPEAPLETMMAIGSAIPASIIGGGAGILKGLFGGKYGTPEVEAQMKGRAGEVSSALTYAPRKELAQDAMRTIGGLIDKSKIAGLGPTEAVALSAMPVGQAASQIRGTAQSGARRLGDMLRPDQPAMAGGGAAVTEMEAVRRARAEGLPVPVNLSKGEASRDFGQQRFERETAKEGSKAGEILREHGVKENQNLIKNMEWFLDETGAQSPSLRVTGQTVDQAARARSDLMKSKYRDAYTRADKAGETAQLVDTRPLLEFITENASAKKLAGVLEAVESEVVRLGGANKAAPGIVFPEKMSIRDIEKVRKLAVGLGKGDETNGHYAGQINSVIDQMTEGAGGKLYKEARQLYKDHAAEFKNQGVVKKLLAMKPGTTDRSVAYEDVFRHSIISGSLDDLGALFGTLERSGPAGKTAISELKGETMKYLIDQASRNSVKDVNGNPILSYKALNSAVKELEIDGKLDFMFGKKGAQQIRDITDIVGDLNVAPAGVVNTSTTAAVLKDALGAILTGRITEAATKGVQGIKSAVKDYRSVRLAKEAIAPPEGPHVVRPTMH